MTRAQIWPIVYSLLGCILFCFGSLIAIAAPGDGQTGMVVFPCWFVGGGLIVAGLARSVNLKTPTWGRIPIALCAFISLGSAAWSFKAAEDYQKQPTKTTSSVGHHP